MSIAFCHSRTHVLNIAFSVAVKSAAPAQGSARPLAVFERQRLGDKIAAVTCSAPWTDHAVPRAEQQGVNPSAENIERQLADRGIYPPRADLGRDRLPRRCPVRMRRCDACGRIVPPNNVASHRLVRLCDDCRFEPEVDLDRKMEMERDVRAPGVHSCVLVQGPVGDDDTQRNAARQRLQTLGLTDSEIMALSFTHAGYSTRRVAEFGGWSQTYVRKLLTSADRKLRRSGLQPPRTTQVATVRPVTIDPVKLDGLANRVRRV